MLENFSLELDKTESRLDMVSKKVAQVLQLSDGNLKEIVIDVFTLLQTVQILLVRQIFNLFLQYVIYDEYYLFIMSTYNYKHNTVFANTQNLSCN